MNLRILSDLHLEYSWFDVPKRPEDASSVLIIAGDIASFAHKDLIVRFLTGVADRFRAVLVVPGNHEFYGALWPDALNEARSWGLPANVHWLDRTRFDLDDVTFLGATLWTDFDREDSFTMAMAGRQMNDYHYIRVSDAKSDFQGLRTLRYLTPSDILKEHKTSKAWLKKALKTAHQEGRKTVVITHHGVSPQSMDPQFEGDPLNGAFFSDLTSTFKKHPPALIIHGHTHTSLDYRLSGDTGPRVVVNPRGYVRNPARPENPRFDPMLIIDV